MDHYVLMTECEKLYQIQPMIKMPRNIVRKFLIRPDIVLINKLSRYFINSMKLVTDRCLTTNHSYVADLHRQMHELSCLCYDDINLSIDYFDDEEKNDSNNVLALFDNFAFLPLVYLDADNKYTEDMNTELFQRRLKMLIPNFVKFLKLYEKIDKF